MGNYLCKSFFLRPTAEPQYIRDRRTNVRTDGQTDDCHFNSSTVT